MKQTEMLPNIAHYELAHFSVETLKVVSSKLKNNPLNDPTTRFNPLLVPHSKGPSPVAIVLGGFSGNASFYVNAKFNERNPAQVIDQAYARGEAPAALYVFVDALTTWGGSQFINSAATGNYEDYIVQELVPALRKLSAVSQDPTDWCICGGSSGGYGALHLGSKYPELFGRVAAIAPDSFFEASLLPEFYHALPLWDKYQGSARKALEELRNGRLMKNKNWHSLLNAFGMAACYCPEGISGDFKFPLDIKTGEKIPELWQRYLRHDPLHFLPERVSGLQKLAGIYLDVGTKDNFHLQYGARQISKILKDQQILHDYVEFDGNHFDIGDRRIEVWKWLAHLWR
ncbi:MAG: enterochelin esterase [Bdellovibrio sp.]|nr:enterochelin esterase [Bdellovibrio sp.]